MIGIHFQYPILLGLVPILIVLVGVFSYHQLGSLKEILIIAHPKRLREITSFLYQGKENSPRFLRFYVYIFFLGASLISLGIAVSGPFFLGDSEVLGQQRNIYIVIDGSWSMRGTDHMNYEAEYKLKPGSRFGEAKAHSVTLIGMLEGFNVGVMTYAQNPVQHTYPHPDIEWVETVLRQTNLHNIFHSGNNVKLLLEFLVSTSRFHPQGYQVVLYSDGDISEEEEKNALEYLPILKRMKVPIHIIALGTRQGSKLTMSYNRLVQENVAPRSGGSDRAGQKYKATENVVIQEKQSEMRPDFLKKLASETGGIFIATESGNSGLSELKNALERNKDKTQTLIWEATGRKDATFYYLLIPLFFYLLDAFLFRRGAKK